MGLLISKIINYFHDDVGVPIEQENADAELPSNENAEDAVMVEKQRIFFSPDANKRALLIGINYFNTNNVLRGCINDVNDLSNFLREKLFFTHENIFKMKDDLEINSEYYPSSHNIKHQIQELVDWANHNEKSEIWLSYSGHGYYINDYSNDEIDGKEEVLCPVVGEFIKDDWLKEILINKLNGDVKLFIIMDCCHSGTICDIQKECSNNMQKNICMISGCRDNQTSADAAFWIRDEYEWRGALTHHFIQSFTPNLKEHHANLLKSLDNKFTQKPILSFTGKEEDMENTFLLKA